MATKMAQLNVRMDPELKAAGDSVLDLYGVSPSELVRAIWDKVAHGKEALQQLIEVLVKDPAVGSPRTSKTTSNGMTLPEWAAWRQEEFAKEMGLDPSTHVPLTDEELEELLYEDYLEKWRERELQPTNPLA